MHTEATLTPRTHKHTYRIHNQIIRRPATPTSYQQLTQQLFQVYAAQFATAAAAHGTNAIRRRHRLDGRCGVARRRRRDNGGGRSMIDARHDQGGRAAAQIYLAVVWFRGFRIVERANVNVVKVMVLMVIVMVMMVLLSLTGNDDSATDVVAVDAVARCLLQRMLMGQRISAAYAGHIGAARRIDGAQIDDIVHQLGGQLFNVWDLVIG